MQAELGSRTYSGPPARAVLRFNGIATGALGAVVLSFASSIGRALGSESGVLVWLAGLALIALGIDEIAFAVGRRVRTSIVLPVAAVDVVASVAAVIIAVASGSALSGVGRGLLVIGAVVLASFAVAEVRATRGL
jgi:hypothetical protein